MFLRFCFWLNVIGLSRFVARLRERLHRRYARWAKYGHYSRPEEIGYKGWIELPIVGVVCFERLNADSQGRYHQYEW